MKTPGGKLQPDDIEPGMLVTVLQYHDVLERHIEGPDVEFWSKREDQFGVGLAFLVVAVDLPFCVLRCASCDCGRVLTFDTRTGDLKRLTQQYVDALRPPPPQPQQGGTRVVAVPPGSSLLDIMRMMMPDRPSPEAAPKTEPPTS